VSLLLLGQLDPAPEVVERLAQEDAREDALERA
jgi:hypothetical protein